MDHSRIPPGPLALLPQDQHRTCHRPGATHEAYHRLGVTLATAPVLALHRDQITRAPRSSPRWPALLGLHVRSVLAVLPRLHEAYQSEYMAGVARCCKTHPARGLPSAMGADGRSSALLPAHTRF